MASLLLLLSILSISLNAQEDSTQEKKEVFVPVVEVIDSSYKTKINQTPLLYTRYKNYSSLQQIVKGLLPGTFIQEPSGEPGVDQNVFVNGLMGPLITKRDLYDQQAVVFLNGIPLQRDHPFAYEIQKYDQVRIGSGTNNLAIFNMENLESIEVIKDPIRLAALGPLAANGAIWVTTKNARPGISNISVNLHSGVVTVPEMMPVNAAYEYNFRRPFYDRYNENGSQSIPFYLRDSTNVDYYGPANWYKSYYKPTLSYGADASLTGGSERANFRLFLSGLRDANSADNTSLKKYNAAFYVTVIPVKWLTFNTSINFNRLDRTRNRNISDRISEQRYIPDLTNPLTPNRVLYDKYLEEFEKAIDINTNNSLQTAFSAVALLKKLTLKTAFALDYGEGIRDAFWPTTLLEGNNFVSNYYGVNQRLLLTSSATYKFDLGANQSLSVGLNQSFNNDFQRYKYAYAYNGPNDFIKINLFNRNGTDGTYTAYYYPNKMQQALASFFGNVDYSYANLLKVSAVVRRDGSSSMQPNNRWFTGYSAGFDYDLSKQLNIETAALSIQGSYAKVGKPLSDDRYSTGPVYSSYLGWELEPTLGTYAGLPGIARPYTGGWIGYDIPWAYYNKFNIGARLGLFAERLTLGIDYYNRMDKNGLVLMPVPSEWGYVGEYKSGIDVNNKGVDIVMNAKILPVKSDLQWSFYGNMSINSNTLKALPDGVQSTVTGNTKLEVGKPVDGYWVYENAGTFNSDADIPRNPSNGKVLTFQGLPLSAGDPRWVDKNGDYNIDEDDKVLKGHYMPKQYGGFGTVLAYKKLSLDVMFYYALGRDALNQYASNRLNFVNTDNGRDLNSVKEITYWEKKEDLSRYPQYNPWSDVIAYRSDQDLFVQNASFLKLRTVTLSYNLVGKSFMKKLKAFNIYVTGTNLLTFTKFKGDDPELLTYQGVYNGRALPLPRIVTLGAKIDL